MAKESERGGVIPTAKESEWFFGGRSLRDGDRHGYGKAREGRSGRFWKGSAMCNCGLSRTTVSGGAL